MPFMVFLAAHPPRSVVMRTVRLIVTIHFLFIDFRCVALQVFVREKEDEVEGESDCCMQHCSQDYSVAFVEHSASVRMQ